MDAKKKKPYNKPGIVYQDNITGEMSGSEWMIEKIIKECEEMRKAQGDLQACPFEDSYCSGANRS